MTQSARQFQSYCALLVVLTLVETKITDIIHAPHFQDILDASRWIVIGTPHTRIFQSRLLGPELVNGLTVLFHGKFDRWYNTVMILTLLAANLVTFGLFSRLTDTRRAFGYAFVGVFLYIALQNQFWLYIWDHFDILFFTLFAYGAYRGKGLAFFVPLFLVELLNREAALFISLWLVLDAFRGTRDAAGVTRLRLASPSFLVVGVALTVLGEAWTDYIRNRLFKHSGLPGGGADLAHLHSNMLMLSTNWDELVTAMTRTTVGLDFLAFALFPAALICLWQSRRFLTERTAKMALLLLVMLGSLIIYGSILETRIFLSLIPFALFLHFGISEQAARRPAPLSAGAGPSRVTASV